MTLTFDDTQTAALLAALGLPADTTDPQLVVDTATDLAAQVAEVDPAKPSQVAAAAAAAGLEVLDKATADALRHDASEGRKLVAAATAQRIAASVDEAISKGKITPSRRDHWLKLIEADPGMADVLAAVPAETAVPLSELGHSTEPEDADAPAWFR